AREPGAVTPPAAAAPRGPDGRPHHPVRQHTVRSERTPVTPVGSRRPPHADRVPRTTAPFGPPAGRGRTPAGG
ncbi:hypothetical protein AB0G58_36515, partial [Streptomyces sp. NPDC022067]